MDDQALSQQRAKIIGLTVEVMSLRAITRITGVSRTTPLRLLEDAVDTFSEYQARTLRNLPCRRIQVDEAWALCYAKQRNVATAKAAPQGAGDIWTWVGFHAETKLAMSFFVGGRDGGGARMFINDLVGRLANRLQLTSNGPRIISIPSRAPSARTSITRSW